MKEDLSRIALVGPGGRKKLVDVINEIVKTTASPDNDTMSKDAQMKTRKNLGLYYEETAEGEKTAQYTDETFVIGLAKISDDAPAKEDIIDVRHDGTSIEFSIIEDGNGIFHIENSSLSGIFYIVAEEGTAPFTSPGIYIPEGYGDYELVYNGETTVVHKIPERFLPEQESSGMPVIRLLKMPPTTNPDYNVTVNITEYFSQEDADKLFNLESCFIVYNDDYGMSFVTTKGVISHGMMGDITKSVYIKDFQENEFMFSAQDWGVGTIQYGIQYTPKQTDTVDITQLPTNGMTQQELEGIGITVNELLQIGHGNKRGFKLVNFVYPVVSVDYFNSYNLIIEFWTSTNKYVISVDTTMMSILSCTVTSR